jgi:hypothetical protein
MTAIQWNQAGDRQFETGVDHGVLYPTHGPGVAWNGLVSVDDLNNNTVEGVYYEGIKFNEIVVVGEYSGVIRAYTYPEEFYPFDGVQEDQRGLYLEDQAPERFGLCYRTSVGDDISGINAGYKLHLLYNLTANAAQKTYESLSLDAPTPVTFEWNISAIPEDVEGYRPTAHVVVDSQEFDPWLLRDLEAILYGDDTRDPTLPPLKALLSFIRKWERLIIVDNGDGTWTAIDQDDGTISMTTSDEFSITADSAVYLDANTYEISSSDKNEEDIN